jgi:antitoxin component YwqK of YwqJK toxin-antitoxin module
MKMKMLMILTVCFVINLNAQEKHILYFDSGKVSTVINFNNEEQTDLSYEYYYETGDLRKTTRTINGLFEGTTIEYYWTGTVKTVLVYTGGILNGVCSFYHNNGKLQLKGMVSNNNKVGQWKEYNYYGLLVNTVNY